jgi:hypothetical protein
MFIFGFNQQCLGDFTAGKGKVPKTVSRDFETIASLRMVKCQWLGGHMHVSWIDRLTFVAWLAVLAVTAFFSFRYMIRFQRQVKHNREAGIYDDPEFKRQIRPLNIMRYSLVKAEVLSVVPVIWASAVRLAPEIWIPVWLVLFLPIAIELYFVDRRWHKLMTKGVTHRFLKHKSPSYLPLSKTIVYFRSKAGG